MEQEYNPRGYFLYTCGRCETMGITEPVPSPTPLRCPICGKFFILAKKIDEDFAMEYKHLIQHVEEE